MLRDFTIICLLLVTGSAAYPDAPFNAGTSEAPIISKHRALREDSATVRSLGLGRSDDRHQSFTCCKICSAGKACGNTCISRDDVCRVGPGCACDG